MRVIYLQERRTSWRRCPYSAYPRAREQDMQWCCMSTQGTGEPRGLEGRRSPLDRASQDEPGPHVTASHYTLAMCGFLWVLNIQVRFSFLIFTFCVPQGGTRTLSSWLLRVRKSFIVHLAWLRSVISQTPWRLEGLQEIPSHHPTPPHTEERLWPVKILFLSAALLRYHSHAVLFTHLCVQLSCF